MDRYITSIKFNGGKVIVEDNVGQFVFDGEPQNYCPGVVDRWKGYMDRVRQEWDSKYGR